ncbi:MAG: metallophosphoesterase [Lachnospiraceae bacterium]|nr:metallophosphoesterase [Lachnospiraceae bacterium]
MEKQTIQKEITRLKEKQISPLDISEEDKYNPILAKYERESGLLLTDRRGFDIISNRFFVEERISKVMPPSADCFQVDNKYFDSFDEYYEYLNGSVYDESCYSFCPEDKLISKYEIDKERLFSKKAFTTETIDEYLSLITDAEMSEYREREKTHKLCCNWRKKYLNCHSGKDLIGLIDKYSHSVIADTMDYQFFLSCYLTEFSREKFCFDSIIELMASDIYLDNSFLSSLCVIFDPEIILDALKRFPHSYGIKKIRKIYRDIKHKIGDEKPVFYVRGKFDPATHFFCEEISEYSGNKWVATFNRYFESFEDFATYRKGNLRHCDFSKCLENMDNIDYSGYMIDETTVLPLLSYHKCRYEISKRYRKNEFLVSIRWYDTNENEVKTVKKSFQYFFDFVSFLKNDLSDAYLISCDGLQNLESGSDIDFTGVRLTSNLCKKMHIKYEPCSLLLGSAWSFAETERNEKETELILSESREIVSSHEDKSLLGFTDYDSHCQRVHYISDLHLMHKIMNAGCVTENDVFYVIDKIARTIAEEAESLLLIAGDVSSDFNIFRLFVKCLSAAKSSQCVVVFTLGNHDLWGIGGKTFSEITGIYRELIEKHGMYLLQNGILYRNDYRIWENPSASVRTIPYEDLCRKTDKQLTDDLRKARYVIFGGLGFSGQNEIFNANQGIYLDVVTREEEIKESEKFAHLYDRLLPILTTKNAIIMTHTPKSDWSENGDCDDNLVFVNGHTHKNQFYDDGCYRLYADNQIGYSNKNPHLKSLLLDGDYDCFSDYDDGIYSITREQYCDFYRGKNIMMTFTRDYPITMLKKRGYYCFLVQTKKGVLSILNGGSMKPLPGNSVQYFYDNMGSVIANINTPLMKYTEYQKVVADEIKKIGGDGTIHGCIVDIDKCNHIYVNPIDKKLTAYYAPKDIIDKTVYPSIVSLLEEQCPKLYQIYERLMLAEGQPNALIQQQNGSTKPTKYLSTDIYEASRVIKKMQKIHSNILSIWAETSDEIIDLTKTNAIPSEYEWLLQN